MHEGGIAHVLLHVKELGRSEHKSGEDHMHPDPNCFLPVFRMEQGIGECEWAKECSCKEEMPVHKGHEAQNDSREKHGFFTRIFQGGQNQQVENGAHGSAHYRAPLGDENRGDLVHEKYPIRAIRLVWDRRVVDGVGYLGMQEYVQGGS